MASKTIGQLDAATSVALADLIEIEQSGVSKYASVDLLLNDETREMSASGIKFPATQVPSADANTLDDYEEGTWTPVYETASGALGTVTYDSVQGKYTKIGNMVYVHCFIRTSDLAIGTASGTLYIAGLPFAGVGTNQAVPIPFSSNFVGEEPNGGVIATGTSRVILYYKNTSDGNSAISQATDLQTGTSAAANYVLFTAAYHTT